MMTGSESQQLYEAAFSRTNAKLQYAEIHLEELRTCDRTGKDYERAHLESFLFHLFGVYDAYFQELNLFHDCGLELEKVSRHNLQNRMRSKKIHSAALEKLLQIEDDSESWLAQAKEMRNHATHRNNIPRVNFKGGENDGEVHLTDTSSGSVIEEDYVRLFENWAREMRSLIDELRTTN